MKKILNIFSYYFLILLGLIITSWVIWARFLRERVIKEIPDALLTEYRFWILLYICSIYIFVIKNLIIEKKPNIYFITINKFITMYLWKPLMTFDHAIKYNIYFYSYYQAFLRNIIKFWDKLSITWQRVIIFNFYIIPRIFLVIVLLMDTFVFNKLEIFYKIVLIGLIPFIFRYVIYSVKDFYEQLIKKLSEQYEKVLIFEKGYRNIMSRKDKTEAIWHYEWATIEEYVEILYENYFENLINNVSYEYVGDAYCHHHIYKIYEKEFNKPVSSWTYTDIEKVRKLFDDLIPIIMDIKYTYYLFEIYKKEKKIIRSKIAIFSLYLICWGYILITSYYNYPVELPMFKYFAQNILTYLIIGEDPFIGSLKSINENLITPHSIKNLIINIIENIKK